MTVHVVYSWLCQQCEERGEGDGSDLAARKHEAARGHATRVEGRPAGA